MKKDKKIRYLVTLSLTKGKLDPKKISVIIDSLSRRQKRVYLELILAKRQEEKVTITTAVDARLTVRQRLERFFPDKEIVLEKNPELIAGLVVQFQDTVFDASLKGYLEEIKNAYEINR